MNDFVLVEIDEGVDDLLEIVCHFHLSQSLSPLDELVESLVGANFQENVDIFVVLEDMLEANDMGVT